MNEYSESRVQSWSAFCYPVWAVSLSGRKLWDSNKVELLIRQKYSKIMRDTAASQNPNCTQALPETGKELSEVV